MHQYNELHQFDGAVLVAKAGAIVFEKGYGLANRDWNQQNTVTTKFRIASVTKQFTAVLIMKLKEEGKLKLQDPVSKYLPWYRKAIGDRVTIYDLATQSSGIREYTTRPDYNTDIVCHNYSPVEFIKKFCNSDSLDFEPGSRYAYSNSNFCILGAIIEAVTKQSFGELMQEKVLSVAKLTGTGVDAPGAVVLNKATGYDYEFGKYVNSDYININSSCFASGNLYSTVGDLYLWTKALQHGKLLSKTDLDTLLNPRFEGYAMGLHLNKVTIPGIQRELTFIAHNGNITGFNAIVAFVPELDETIVLLRNEGLQSFKVDLNTILITLFNIANKLPFKMPEPILVSVFADKVIAQNLDSGLSFFEDWKRTGRQKFDISTEESDLNSFGYYLAAHNRIKDALTVFKLNTQEFPRSGNAFDSYAETLALDGQKEEAIKMYKKSLEFNPENENAKRFLSR